LALRYCIENIDAQLTTSPSPVWKKEIDLYIKNEAGRWGFAEDTLSQVS
jgi:hypothetical protein